MDYKFVADQVDPRTGATQEWVFRVLRTGIVNGLLPGGMQLKQDEISAALNVSHIPVREALRQLEAQGLVRIHPNRGASVSKHTRATLEEMMEIRATLSVMALKHSAPFLSEEDYEQLYAIIRAQQNESDLFRTEELNYKFHEILSSRDDNRVAELLMEIIHANIDRYLRSNFYSDAEARAFSVAEHKHITDLCHEGRYDEAGEALQNHILNAKIHIPANME